VINFSLDFSLNNNSGSFGFLFSLSVSFNTGVSNPAESNNAIFLF
jgi:hypothetical protein